AATDGEEAQTPMPHGPAATDGEEAQTPMPHGPAVADGEEAQAPMPHGSATTGGEEAQAPRPHGPATTDGEETLGAQGSAPADLERRPGADGIDEEDEGEPEPDGPAATLAAALTTQLSREEATAAPVGRATPDAVPWDEATLPLFPLQPPRSARELLTEHVTAMVCCAAMDTAGATPGLDWLDGPTLLLNGERATDLTPRVLSLVEDGDPAPLRAWLRESGIRPEKPVRLG
ncbi:hypothetical protein ABZZ74_36505, partial [Streptomyces sp. NPDC006476]